MAHLTTTQLDVEDLLRMVAHGFGLGIDAKGKAGILVVLQRFLDECLNEGRRAVLVVDESHRLSVDALEELRMLANYTNQSGPVMQAVFSGQTSFLEQLACDSMEPFRQRIIASHRLEPLEEFRLRIHESTDMLPQ